MDLKKKMNNMEEIIANYTKVILLSDVHYGLKGGGDNTLNYLGWLDRTDAYFREFLIPLIENVKSDGHMPCLVICGDFFDNRVSLRIDIINRAIDIVKELSKHIDVYIFLE